MIYIESDVSFQHFCHLIETLVRYYGLIFISRNEDHISCCEGLKQRDVINPHVNLGNS